MPEEANAFNSAAINLRCTPMKHAPRKAAARYFLPPIGAGAAGMSGRPCGAAADGDKQGVTNLCTRAPRNALLSRGNAMKLVLTLIGVVLLVIAAVYFVVPADQLPGFLPGHEAGVTK